MEEKVIERLLKELEEKKDLFFSEIEEIFREENFDYKGDKYMIHPENKNLILWAGWNQETINLINKILEIPKAFLVQCNDIEILLHSVMLDFPIAKRVHYKYKNIHWLPIKLALRYDLEKD